MHDEIADSATNEKEGEWSCEVSKVDDEWSCECVSKVEPINWTNNKQQYWHTERFVTLL